jgi:aminopeptidase YwaD
MPKFIKSSTFFIVALLLSAMLLACGETSPTATLNLPTATTAVATTAPASTTTVAATTAANATATATQAPPTATRVAPTTAPATTAASTTAPVTTVAPTTAAPATTVAPAATTAALATTAAVAPAPSAPVNGDFSGDAAMVHVQELAGKIGVRVAGSEGERRAGDYIENYFKGLNLTVQRPAYEINDTVDKGSVMNYGGSRIRGNAMVFSGSGKLNGNATFVGLGRPEDFAGANVRGRIAIIDRGTLTFYEKGQNALNAGATGVIFVNNVDEPLVRVTLGRQVNFPALGISKTEGDALKAALQANPNLSIELDVNISNTPIKMTNVVGVRPGNSPTAPIIIIGGHYDSVPGAPGANDNASGTAITMELARVLKDKYPQYEMRFIAFAGEEIGLTGSVEYVSKMSQADIKRTVAMLNIDMVAVGNTLNIGGEVKLLRLAQTAALEIGAGDVQAQSTNLAGNSDHYPFQQAGIPVLFFNRPDDPNYHRPGDSVDKIKPARLATVGQIVTKIIDGLK